MPAELTKIGYRMTSDNFGHWFRKRKAVDIGRLGKLASYNILMRFASTDGLYSDWKLMASFSTFDKDNFRMSGCLLAIISVLVTIVTVFLLRTCGLKQ